MNSDACYRSLVAGMLGALVLLDAHYARSQPVNDLFANRTLIAGTNIVLTASNVGATREVGEPYHAGCVGSCSVWWSWTAPAKGTVILTTEGSTFDTLLAVYVGSSIAYLDEVASNDDVQEGVRTSKVAFDVVAGWTYQIAVDGYGTSSGTVSLNLQLGPWTPPQPAPAWQLADPYGAVVHSTNFAGKVVLLNFWGTTCDPCRAEMPGLADLQDRYRADGLAIIGADVSWCYDTPASVRAFLAAFTPAINYQIVMSTTANEAGWGGIPSTPTTFLVDRQNLVRTKWIGAQSESALERQILPLLYNNMSLASEHIGSEIVLRWRANAATFSLQSSASLVNPDWTAWPTLPTVENGSNTVRVATSASSRFFRLRLVR